MKLMNIPDKFLSSIFLFLCLYSDNDNRLLHCSHSNMHFQMNAINI